MRKVKIPDTKLQASVAHVTPQVAQQWLRDRARNRRTTDSRVTYLATRMELGEWCIGQALLFDEDGALLDGRHRLEAVVQYGKPIDFLCIHGYNYDETFGILDETQRRRLSDWLGMLGKDHPVELQALARMVWCTLGGRNPTAQGGSFTVDTGLQLLRDDPTIEEALRAPGVSNRLLSRAQSAYCWWLFVRLDKAVANCFFVDLITGETFDGDPYTLLRTRFRKSREEKKPIPSRERIALCIKVWNLIRNDEKAYQLRFQDSEPFPKPI